MPVGGLAQVGGKVRTSKFGALIPPLAPSRSPPTEQTKKRLKSIHKPLKIKNIIPLKAGIKKGAKKLPPTAGTGKTKANRADKNR